MAKPKKGANDSISLWWILAGMIGLGLLFIPSRLSNTSSRHKGYRWMFVLLFVLFIIAYGTSAAPDYISVPVLLLTLFLPLVMYLSFRKSDVPLATMSLYVFIGVLISFALGFAIGIGEGLSAATSSNAPYP